MEKLEMMYEGKAKKIYATGKCRRGYRILQR